MVLLQVIRETYVNSVSTRKIENLAKKLGIDSISRGQVSQITKELNDRFIVNGWGYEKFKIVQEQ